MHVPGYDLIRSTLEGLVVNLRKPEVKKLIEVTKR